MRIIHLGGSELGHLIHTYLSAQEGRVESVSTLRDLEASLRRSSFDWMISAGFRYVVPKYLLELVPDSCNVHTSLLPWGKGAHPNVWAIADSEPAGVTLHRMTEQLDTGPIYAQQKIEIEFSDTAKDVYGKLEAAALSLFAVTWPAMREGVLEPRAQIGTGSYHRREDFEELRRIDMDASLTWAEALRLLRALTFPPFENFVVYEGGYSYHVEISITRTSSE